MAKETFYFSHDYNARNDEKILELRAEFGPEGYGIFWMIIETMAENENSGVKASLIGGLSLGYGVAKERLCRIFDRCLELKLFYEEDGYYFSNRLLSHKNFRNKLSIAGKKGAEMKWGGHRGGYSTPYAKERKEKEIKEKENRKRGFGGKNEKRGLYYLEDQKVLVFDDETCQDLTNRQLEQLKNREIRPSDIFRVDGKFRNLITDSHTAQISPQNEK